MSTQQRFEKGSVRDSLIETRLSVYEFCKQSTKRARCSHRTLIRKAFWEHRLYISISQLSHRPSQLKMQRRPIPRAHTRGKVFSPQPKQGDDCEDEAWRLVCVCEDRQSEFYHDGTTGQTFDSPRQFDSSTEPKAAVRQRSDHTRTRS